MTTPLSSFFHNIGSSRGAFHLLPYPRSGSTWKNPSRGRWSYSDGSFGPYQGRAGYEMVCLSVLVTGAIGESQGEWLNPARPPTA